MFYDIYLAIDTGSRNLVKVISIGNYTGNVSPMWDKALGPTGNDDEWSLKRFNGKNAGDSVNVISAGVRYMEQNRKEMEEMAPKNGWGDYKGALAYLRRLLDNCIEHPKCTIEVCS